MPSVVVRIDVLLIANHKIVFEFSYMTIIGGVVKLSRLFYDISYFSLAGSFAALLLL